MPRSPLPVRTPNAAIEHADAELATVDHVNAEHENIEYKNAEYDTDSALSRRSSPEREHVRSGASSVPATVI